MIVDDDALMWWTKVRPMPTKSICDKDELDQMALIIRINPFDQMAVIYIQLEVWW